jgi:hypothetical protein
MATVTIEVPDELSELVAQAGDRLPELLAQSLKEPTLPAHPRAGGSLRPDGGDDRQAADAP